MAWCGLSSPFCDTHETCVKNCQGQIRPAEMRDMKMEFNFADVPLAGRSRHAGRNSASGSLHRTEIDFQGLGVVPAGCVELSASVPSGFLLLGGDARGIMESDNISPEELAISDVSSSSSAGRRSVLVALPSWAIDKDRARRLLQLQSMYPSLRFCKLRRVLEPEVKATKEQQTVLEFDWPGGEALCDRRRRSPEMFCEAYVRGLCRDLLEPIESLHEWHLDLRGFLSESLVFIDAGDLPDVLPMPQTLTILPVGCLLSHHGQRAAVSSTNQANRCRASGDSTGLAPELLEDSPRSDGAASRRGGDTGGASDVYAVGALTLSTLSALPGFPPVTSEAAVLKLVSDEARSLLVKMLYDDPLWRLSCGQALGHPWLRDHLLPGVNRV